MTGRRARRLLVGVLGLAVALGGCGVRPQARPEPLPVATTTAPARQAFTVTTRHEPSSSSPARTSPPSPPPRIPIPGPDHA